RGGHRIVPDDADHPAQPLVWRDAALMVGSQNCGANPTVGLIDILRTDNERSDAKPVTGPVDHRPSESRLFNAQTGGDRIDRIVTMHGRGDRLSVAQEVLKDKSRKR